MAISGGVFPVFCALVSTPLSGSGIGNATVTASPSAVDWTLFVIPTVSLIVFIGYVFFELYGLIRRRVKTRCSEECGICL